ncbi:hypothetical protein AB0K52_14445 [Glycomyces sp. NPDC049804]|uniref:hypothetical protein n=1 Tax=Glycomyces sp. NPDC049804 TaxID=3154363 RepID=UPI00342287C4
MTVIRFIAKAAIAAAAAGVMAAGMAAPAMAAETTASVVADGYENHQSGGVDLRSDLCIVGLSGDIGLDLDLSDITDLDLFATTDVDSDCDSQSQVRIDIRP